MKNTMRDGVFAPSRTVTETGTGTRTRTYWTIGLLFKYNVITFTQFHRTHLFPVPVLISVQVSVNTPLK